MGRSHYIRSVVCMFVCNVRALCSNGRRYQLYFSPMSLPVRVEIWLT